MSSGNWRPYHGGEAQPPPTDGGDWRSQLPPDARPRIVNKILLTLQRHLPYSDEEGLQELNGIAIRFENRIYNTATSQSDYLRKISLKMFIIEPKSQNALPNAMLSNSAARNPQAVEDGNSYVEKCESMPEKKKMERKWRKISFSSQSSLPYRRETQPPPMAGVGGDWRSQLQPDPRQRIVNRIMLTLQKHLPFSGEEGLQELNRIATRFEDRIYNDATSQSDYLRKISLKMLTMESKSRRALDNATPSNSAARNPQADENGDDEKCESMYLKYSEGEGEEEDGEEVEKK